MPTDGDWALNADAPFHLLEVLGLQSRDAFTTRYDAGRGGAFLSNYQCCGAKAEAENSTAWPSVAQILGQGSVRPLHGQLWIRIRFARI